MGWLENRGEEFPGGSVVKNLPANIGDVSLIPGLGRSPGGGNGNLLHHSCLENPMDRGVWRAIVHEVAKTRTRLTLYQKRNILCKTFLTGRRRITL